MNQLLHHLDPNNASFVHQLYVGTHSYSEATKILYRHLHTAVSEEVETIRITPERIEFQKSGQLHKYCVIEPFETRLKTTFRERFLQMLEVDKVLNSHIDLRKNTPAEIVAKIVY